MLEITGLLKQSEIGENSLRHFILRQIVVKNKFLAHLAAFEGMCTGT